MPDISIGTQEILPDTGLSSFWFRDVIKLFLGV